MRTALLAVLLAALMAAPALAGVEPFPPNTWVIPDDGSTRTASSWPAALPSQMLSFTVYIKEYEELPEQLEVTVATSPATDADGILAGAGVIDSYEAPPVDGYVGIFSARTPTDAQWVGTPGTYYWQATYEEYEDGEEELYAAPVHSLVIVPQAAPDPPQTSIFAAPPAPVTPAAHVVVPQTPAARTARKLVRRAILAGTHRRFRGLTYRCTTTPGAATCRPTWRNDRYRYRGTLKIATGLAGISASFTGTRAARSGARPYSFTVRL